MRDQRQSVWTGFVLGIGALLPWSSVPAQESTVQTQVPEIAPSIVAGSDPANVQADFTAVHAKFDQGPKPQWIWGPNDDTSYFLTKELPAGIKSAWLKAAADNRATVWINNQKVLENSNWQTATLADVTSALKADGNVIRAKVENEGGVAAFLAKVVIETDKGELAYVVTDDSWVVTQQRNSKEKLPVKSRGELGVGPWGNVFASREEPGGLRDLFELRPGFQVERLFTVPKEEFGSWVSITFDDKGRLIASDQGDKGLYRITPSPIGSEEPTKVEKIPVNITSSQGMLWADGGLYVSVNGGPGSGLYRATDSDSDGMLDTVKQLHAISGGGEHGPHALRKEPGGSNLYMIAGNHTRPPFEVERNADPQTMGGARETPLKTKLPPNSSSHIPTNWDEDLLLKRQWDANGHAAGVLAPGGWIAKTDPDGQTWEIISVGYRNPYDMAFNADGELFAYDADMEWDVGSPWYRPTRVVHSTSGSEFGWRSGTGKWPAYYPDSLPAIVDIGPGSPVGVEFGYGTKFPAKYQKALFICDWTFGTMYAIHITPEGASYRGEKEEFVSRTPLPLTDVAVGPDGALYFTIGGRGTQSELFRVTYVGEESTAPAELKDAQFAELRALRHKLEEHHASSANPQETIALAWPYLSHADRHIRYAARIAIEQQPVDLWRAKVIAEKNPVGLMQAAIALAHQGEQSDEAPLVTALSQLSFGSLTEAQQLDLLRTWSLVFIRLGAPDDATAAKVAASLDPFYPSSNRDLNRELCTVLVFLKSPTVIAKTLALLQQPDVQTQAEADALLARNPGYGGSIRAMLANQPDMQKVNLLFALKDLKTGWTIDQRKIYFDALAAAKQKSGGNSYRKFIQNIDDEAFYNAPEAERLAIEALGARQKYIPPSLPKPQGPGKDWTLDDVLASTQGQPLKGRDFKNGEKMFSAARCVICHRFNGDGGATGPDLTQSAGRFTLKDLCEAIVDPSKIVSDQYKATTILTADGKSHTGRVVSDTPMELVMSIDPEDATKLVTIKKTDIDEQVLSSTSIMPKDLLKPLNENEVLDLLAYVLSRGNPRDAMFRK
ncbi:c-type cytochrome [bacterium]|nr:c-type cytochrome [bacterium]